MKTGAVQSYAWVCLAYLAACGPAAEPTAPSRPAPPAAPTTIAARAPADTRVLVHLGHLADAMRSGDVGQDGGVHAVLVGCNLDPARDLGTLDAFVDEKLGVRIELSGIDLTQAHCIASLFGAPKEGPAAFFGFDVKARAGGGIVVSHDASEGRGAPAALAARFDELVAKNGDAIVARLGAQDVPFEVAFRGRGAKSELAFRVGRARAAAAAARLASLARPAGVEVEPVGEELVVRFTPSAELASTLRSNVVEALKIPSGSMIPTLRDGDHVMAIKDLQSRPLERGEVVVFEDQRGQKFAKRIVALGGDHLVIDGDVITLGGHRIRQTDKGAFSAPASTASDAPLEGRLFEETIGTHTYSTLRTNIGMLDTRLDTTIPADHVFVMGDNRNNSYDSRMFGAIPVAKVLARPALIYFSASPRRGVDWDRVLTTIE